MSKISYIDDTFAVIKYDDSKYGKYTKYMPSDAKFVLLLPYTVHKGKMNFLVKKERIYAWDLHTDFCGITMPVKYEPEVTACHIAKTEIKLDIKEKELLHLGMSFVSKFSKDSYYIFALNTSVESISLENDLNWLTKEEVVKCLDPILITAVTRLSEVIN